MKALWKYFIFISWMSYLMIAGVLLFSNGFLLNRISRLEKTECKLCDDESCDIREIVKSPEEASKFCLQPRAKVILLLVDALKYEFAEWYEDKDSSSTYHRNKLPIIRQTLRDHPNRSGLFRFLADPPTTTMQRLKGLTTGSLPTFIDIGSNFASEEILEDSLVYQNRANGVVFMGDDTWTNLFPDKFLRQFPSTSFNVWDLDTVDREVRSRMFFEIRKKDWSLLVAHILGVDHCGHKHGMKHPEMSRKLNETNTFISEIIESLDEGTILFVVGDHGMTETGDHGGDSENEVESALFVYSKAGPLFVRGDLEVVNQIDLVPTLSAILGTPIPFSNLGTTIVDILPSRASDFRYPLHSLLRNLVQTKTYIDTYSSDTYLFSREKLKELDEEYERLVSQVPGIRTQSDFESFLGEAKGYLKLLRNSCLEIWIQFDSDLMLKGLVLIFCTLFFLYLFIDGIDENRTTQIFESSFLLVSMISNLATFGVVLLLYLGNVIHELQNRVLFFTGMTSIALLTILIMQNWETISTNWYNVYKHKRIDYLSRVVLLLTVLGLFSNSYIVEEDRVFSFLLTTLFLSFLYDLRKDDFLESSDKKHRRNQRSFRKTIFVGVLLACVCIRVSNYFLRCREEQRNRSCGNVIFGKTESLVSRNVEKVFLTVTLVTLALYISLIRIWLRNCGNLSGVSVTVMTTQYFPVIIGVCTGSYWVLQRLPKHTRMKLALSWQVNALTISIYLFILLAIGVIFLNPLAIYVLPKKKESISFYQGENLVPRLFERIKESFCKKKLEDKSNDESTGDMPIVYGLGTAYSASFVSFSVFLTLLYALLLGDILAPSTFLLFLASVCVLTLHGLNRFRNANNMAELLSVPSTTLFLWFLIAEYFFYGTGHQATFLTIHWDAAFIGTGGHFYGNIIPAIFIGINTFGSHIILGATLPLLVIVPFTLYLMFPSISKTKFRSEDLRRGELVLFERNDIFHPAVFRVSIKYILFHAIRTFGSMLAATIHSRHLMVWKIFAPKFIFEAVGFFVTIGSVLTSILLLTRIDRKLEHLITKVTKDR